MSQWTDAIEAACEAVDSVSYVGQPDTNARFHASAISAIRAITPPPEVGEEELVEEVAKAVFDAAYTTGLHEHLYGKYDRSPWTNVARSALSVIRSHDRREAEEVRAVLAEVLDAIRREHQMLPGDVWDRAERLVKP